MASKKSNLPERGELVSLAEEMNSVMGLDPVIKFGKKVTDEELIKAIRTEAKEIYAADFEEDPEDADKEFFTADAKKTLTKLGIEIPEDEEGETEEAEEEETEEEPEEKPAKKGKGKAKPEPEPEEEGEEEEEEEEKPVKKGKGKKAAEEEEEDEKPAKKGKAAPVKKTEAPEKKKEASYTRANALADAIESGAKDMKKIDEKSNALYVKKGGKDNLREANFFNRNAIRAIVALDLGTVEDGKFTLND